MRRMVLLMMFGVLFPAALSGVEVFYEQDFEDGAADWVFQGMAISDKKAHSGKHSILSTGKGVGVPSARVPLDLPKKDRLDDVIWFYVDGTSAAILICITFMCGQTMCGDGLVRTSVSARTI